MTTVGVLFERIPEGGWLGTCPTVPGAVAYGDNLTKCRRKLRDAIESVLTYAPSDDLEDLEDSGATEARAELWDVRVPERPAEDLVTQAEIARIAGVSRQAVNQWVRRGDFPRPFTRTARGAAWRRDDILHWLSVWHRVVGRPSARVAWPVGAISRRGAKTG